MGSAARSIRRFAVAASCGALLLASNAFADVIVLKNGRRITATSVKEAADKVSGETPSGTITLPLSIVDHVERDNAAPTDSLRLSRTAGTSNALVAPQPAGRASGIDPAQLQQARREADSGSPAAKTRAAELESATAADQFARGNLDDALVHADRALSYAPNSVPLLLDVAYFRLRRAEYGPALDYLQRARKLEPDTAEIAKLAGWAYYGMNRLAPAVEEWKRSQAIQPDAEVGAALAKAERDLEAEREFREDGSEHFILKHDGIAAPELARAILRELEGDFRSISSTLNYDASEKIGVLLYTSQAFADITRAPSWVGALNDGRIRIPIQGLTSMTPELTRALRHELTHSLVGGKTRGHCPVWLQEGVAQWQDGSRLTPGMAATLLALYDRHEEPSLVLLEGSWMKFDSGFAANAYAWSLAIVESLANSGGSSDVERLLGRVAVDPTTETALRNSLRLDYSALSRFAADYLRKNYGH